MHALKIKISLTMEPQGLLYEICALKHLPDISTCAVAYGVCNA